MAERVCGWRRLYKTHREEDEIGYEFDPRLADSSAEQGDAEIEVHRRRRALSARGALQSRWSS